MAQEKNFVAAIRNEARKEAQKDFAADWGGFWKVAGSYIGQYAMAFVGFFADFAVAYSMLYGSTKHSFASFLGAAAVCVVIQYGYGGATFRIAKAVKTGKISEGRYMRSAIIGGTFGLAALGASLYLSFNFDSVFRVASEPQAEKELVDVNSINAYYDGKIATLRNDYETERGATSQRIAELHKQRTESGEIMWTARRTVERMEKGALATRGNYEAAVAALENERSHRMSATDEKNAATTAKWDAKIVQGAMFTRWFNIAVNLVRVLLIVGYAIFLLDVYQDEEEKYELARGAAPAARQYVPVSSPPPPAATETTATLPHETPKNAVSNGMQPLNMNGVAAELARQRAKARAYRSKLQRNEGNADTNNSGLSLALDEISRLEGILAGNKGV